MRIRKAKPGEAVFLSDLSVRSKAFWGYDEAFMIDAVADLTLKPMHIKNGMVHVCEVDEQVVGYYAFCVEDGPEMIALFVEPDFIGKGVGLKLWNHSVAFASDQNWSKFRIVADPFAADKFYFKMGCIQIGEFQSPVKVDRKLPLLEFDLTSNFSAEDKI